MLMSFWNEKVKGQNHNRQLREKPGKHNIFVTTKGNFASIRSRMYLGAGTF